MTASESATGRPQQVADAALAAATTASTMVIVTESASANLRWANNTLTTNGAMRSQSVTVIAIDESGDGARAASVTRSGVTAQTVAALVAQAEASARVSPVADDAMPLVTGGADGGWDDDPVEAPVAAFAPVSQWLGETFAQAAAAGEGRFGYAEYGVDTTYFASSTGLRIRHAQPATRLELTGRADGGARSAWSGVTGPDPTRLDLAALESDVAQRLEWSKRSMELEAGRYETLLPPSAVADFMVYAYYSANALDAHEGSTVFSAPGGGTRVGESLTDVPLSLTSDPAMAGQQCAPHFITGASSRMASVFDNGLPLARTTWIDRGRLAALATTRHSAATTGLAMTPYVDNLELTVDGATGTLADMVARTERGLLLTCVWYVREVDPRTLLLTGLTRDGVFLVEGGEVVGVVNNFRFNESPIAMMKRITEASTTTDTTAREFGDYFARTRMPALRVGEFNMSSVSQAR